jgi:hypothetical protein
LQMMGLLIGRTQRTPTTAVKQQRRWRRKQQQQEVWLVACMQLTVQALYIVQ